ncbi:unnamed protein product [Urochloa humidicola]
MGCAGSTAKTEDNGKKLKKPKPWKHTQAITPAQLRQMRDEFWDTAPHYGGQKGAKYELPKYVLSEPANLIRDG